ncbi:MAG: hypothetical protein ACRDF9_05915 [Candidatus Limnocylindria bacterium]
MRRLGAILGLAIILAVALPQLVAADSIARTWTVGEEPFGVVVDPTDGRIYVANSKVTPAAGSISVVDPSRASGGVTELVTSGPPGLLALDPIHRRLYSSNQDGNLQVFDLTTMNLEATLSIGGWGVVVDPLTRRVYVADGSSVTVVDGATNTVVDTTPALQGDVWIGLALEPAWHRLYVTNIANSSPSVIVLDDRDLSLVEDIQLPVVPRFAVAVDESQHRLYLAGYDPLSGYDGSMFLAIDGSTFAVLASASVPGGPAGITLAASAHRIYLTSAGAGSTFSGYRVFDDRSFSVVQTVATLWQPALSALHPDGRLYVAAWNGAAPDELAAILLGNSAPEIIDMSFTPAASRTSDVLRINVTAVDRDLTEDPLLTQSFVLTYQWSRNGVVIEGAEGQALDLSMPGNGERGDTITVRVTASDGELSTTATASVVVANTPLTGLMLALSDATPQSRDVLVATATCEDADNDATFTFTWSVNGVVKRIASTTVSDSFDLGSKGNGDNGDVVAVSVVARDGASTTPAVDATATVTPGRRK